MPLALSQAGTAVVAIVFVSVSILLGLALVAALLRLAMMLGRLCSDDPSTSHSEPFAPLVLRARSRGGFVPFAGSCSIATLAGLEDTCGDPDAADLPEWPAHL